MFRQVECEQRRLGRSRRRSSRYALLGDANEEISVLIDKTTAEFIISPCTTCEATAIHRVGVSWNTALLLRQDGCLEGKAAALVESGVDRPASGC